MCIILKLEKIVMIKYMLMYEKIDIIMAMELLAIYEEFVPIYLSYNNNVILWYLKYLHCSKKKLYIGTFIIFTYFNILLNLFFVIIRIINYI